MSTLALGSLGGTLSMVGSGATAGIMPQLPAQELLARTPGLAGLAAIRTHTLGLVPSASLTLDDVLGAYRWASSAVLGGADGVVLTQGTDSLEETAYLLDLLWPHEVPLVVTGAMRGADAAGADGPANVLAAAIAALQPASRARGVLVAMHDQLHAAAFVRKVHSLDLDAFASPSSSCVGRVQEGRCHYRVPAVARPAPLSIGRSDPRVVMLEAVLGQGPELLQAVLERGCSGLVIAGMGAGHVPASWVDPLARAARHLPVLVASRTGAGATARHTYGFAGGEIDLQRHGLHMAGDLCPRKCRLLLWALLGAGALAQLDARLAVHGGGGRANDAAGADP